MFRAYEPDRDRLVAVKLFRLDLAPERVHRLVAELERVIAADLAHPGIAAPLATGIAGAEAYLAEQYCAADSFDLVIRDRGPASPDEALRVTALLAGALDHAFAAGALHGAMHPRDVLISEHDVRLTGLGIARALEEVGIAPPVRRPYAAPERMASQPWDRRADIFGLAALACELLWGRRVTAIGAQAVESLPQLAGSDRRTLCSTFARALAEDPAERFDTALEFSEALHLAFPDVLARPVSASAVGGHLGGPPDEQREELRSAAPEALAETGPDERADDEMQELPLFEERSAPSSSLQTALETSPSEDVELTPSPAAEPVEVSAPFPRSSAGRPGVVPPIVDRSQSAIWPLALALSVGVAIGFGVGYGVGTHDWSASQTGGVTVPAQPPAGGAVPDQRADSSVPSAPAQALPPDPVLAPALTAGHISVRSTPSGASVFIDGREQGRTPAVVRDVAAGTHDVRVVRDGYVPSERQVAITASRPARSLVVSLKRPPSRDAVPQRTSAPAAQGPAHVAGLRVESRPSGARVLLDGKIAGTTPLSLTRLPVGEHTVMLEHDGYRPWTSSVRLVAGARNRVAASLER